MKHTVISLIRAAILAACMVLPTTLPAQTPAQPPVWEVICTAEPATHRNSDTPEINVEVTATGTVTITVDRPTTAKVFSILGQLITQKQIAAGKVRLHMDTRGIFILKAGGATRRINL